MTITPGLYPARESTEYRLKLPQPVKQAKRAYDYAAQFVNVGKVVISAVQACGKTLPTGALRLVGCMQIYSGFAGIFAVPQLCVNIIRTLTAQDLSRRITSLARAILDAGSIMGAVSSVISGLKAVKVISENAISWTGLIGKFLYPLQFLSLALNTYDLTRAWKARASFLKNTEPVVKGESKKRKIEKLSLGLHYIQKNHKEIRKGLSISKRAEIDKRAKDCLQQLESQKEEAIFKAEELLYTLRRHANRRLSLQIASLAIRVTGVVATALTFVTPPNPFTLGTIAAASIIGLAVNGLQSILTPRNPFDSPRIVRIKQHLYPGTCPVIR